MTNRYSDWREDLSKELIKSARTRAGLFKELREDYGDDLKVLRALSYVIGLKEMAKLCGLAPSNLSKYLRPGKDLKISTINKMLTPFGAKTANILLDLDESKN